MDIEDQYIDQKIQRIMESQDFNSLFNSLSLKSEKAIKSVFFVLAKLAYWRERRLERILSHKDVAFLIKVAHFHVVNRILLAAKEKARLLPKGTTCELAQEYFIDHMAGRKVKDRFDREILIPDAALDCFYKDDISGKHTISPEYYRLYRARRLPWVIPTLEQSKECYMLDKPKVSCREYFYISEFAIPYNELDAESEPVEKYHLHYFVVLARRKYGMKTLEFVTEFPMFDYFDLLQYLERWQPFEGE